MAVFKYISEVFKKSDAVIIIPFGGYANEKMIHVQARVLENEGITYTEETSLFRNIYNTYKRFESDEKHNVKVLVSWGDGHKAEVVSDREGYIYLDQPHHLELENPEMLWIPVTYELYKDEKVIFKITSPCMKPSLEADYGIVSDIDDTLIHTGVNSFLKWRLVINSMIKHHHKRLPLEGSQEFYHLLQKGKSGYNENPVFYLSNSPWNLYNYLSAFLKKFDFPKGVVMLRDIGLSARKKKSFMEGNKYRKILHLLETYPEMKFILVGDAAEIDTDIYLNIAMTFPERILSIYIRAVRKASRVQRVEKLIEKHTNIDVLLFRDSDKAIAHAKLKGYLSID